ncbi:unnamed protein product, partial [Mesorhabditis belari]|uniref:CBS domain-containing protein n=1 Tax=Mesorhabditis belari TaxID=2138241 RepID=A0AAF3EYS8_9BILA
MPLTRDSHSVSVPHERPPLPPVASDSPMFVDDSPTHSIKQHEADSYARLLQLNVCYDAMPTSSKMVVFDKDLLMKKAFNGLIYQNTRHVLISSGGDGGKISGILSVTDFIRVLLMKYREVMGVPSEHEVDCNDIGNMTVRQYRDFVESSGKLFQLVSIDANQSILEAARLLAKYRIHRLPVMDPIEGSPLFIITHKRILKFLWCFGTQFSLPEYHVKTPRVLGVGTWENLKMVYPSTPLHECLEILSTQNISGVPVVDEETKKMIGMYSRFDAIAIATDNDPNRLEKSVQSALDFKNFNKNLASMVVSINTTDTFWTAVQVLVDRNVHRLCVLNEHQQVEGIISLADVINYMVVKPGEHLQSPKAQHTPRVQRVEDMSNQELRRLLTTNNHDLEQQNEIIQK